MQLCQNRPEGFKPMSTVSNPLPTQCFFDEFLVPFPTWIFLLGLVALAILLPAKELKGRPRPGLRKRWLRIAFLSVYYFFLAAVAGMHSVEIARLAQADLGVGLLPFAYVGCAAAAASMALRDRLPVQRIPAAALTSAYWTFGMCVSAVKVAALTHFYGTEEGVVSPLARVGTAYPIVDQILDVAVLVGLYALMAVLELVIVLFVVPVVGQGKGTGAPGVAHYELEDK